MARRAIGEEMKFEPGRYYVGDPCYILGGCWDEFNKIPGKVFKFRNKQCYVDYTKHGDGIFYDSESREYPVDVGILGIVPCSILTKEEIKKGKKKTEHLMSLGHFITFKKPFEVSSKDGVFDFGCIHINTTNDEEDIEDEDED